MWERGKAYTGRQPWVVDSSTLLVTLDRLWGWTKQGWIEEELGVGLGYLLARRMLDRMISCTVQKFDTHSSCYQWSLR